MEITTYDVFVIGSGVAGQTAAEACATEGMKVAIADKREFGGTCSNRGCDPKKVLLGVTEVLEAAKNLKHKGIGKLPEPDWKKLQKFKKKFTKAIPKNTEKKLKKLGIEMYHQAPKFLDVDTLSVEGKTIKAKHIVIATGFEHRPLAFKGNEYLKLSDDFLKMKKMPKSIVFIGAGYVGMEFAHMAARAGAKVKVIDTGDRALSAFDEDLVKELVSYSEKIGIEFIFNAKVMSIRKLRKNVKLTYKKNAKKQHLKARIIFNTAGRIPAISGLNLEGGKVAFGKRGIDTNNYLQSTTNRNVYACGDVSDNGLPLSSVSGREGYIAAENIIKGNRKKLDLPLIPSVVFTLPHLASVGYSEEAANKRYKNVVVKYEKASDWFNAKRINAPVYAYKIIINERTDEIVGAHMLGPEAGETINLFAMAINARMTSDDIKDVIFTYPSWASDIKSMV